MRLLQLDLTAFRSYADVSVDLSAVEKVAVVGRNGAGKSSILKAIVFAAFGEGSADELISRGQNTMTVELTVEIDDGTYRIARGRERGKKSWLALERQDENVWESLSEPKIADTQAKIDALLGSYDVFAASVYSPQNQVGAFLALRAGDRKALLGQLLDLGRYEDWREEAARAGRDQAARVSSAVAAQEALAQRLPGQEAKILSDPSVEQAALERAGEALTAAEAELEEAIVRERAVEQVQLRQQLLGERDRLETQIDVIVERNQKHEALATQLADLQRSDVVASLAALEQARYEHERQVAQAAAEKNARAQLIKQKRAEVAQLEKLIAAAAAEAERNGALADAETAQAREIRTGTDTKTCPTCHQPLTSEMHRESVAASHDAAALALTEKITADLLSANETSVRHEATAAELLALEKLEDAPAPAADYDAGALTRAQKAASELDMLRGQLAGVGDPVDHEPLRAQALDLANRAAALPDSVPPGDQPAVVRARISDLQADVQNITLRLRDHDEAVEQRDQLNQAIATHAATAQEAGERQRALEVCARAFGRDGIPAMILDGTVGAIEASANRALEAFGSQMRITLATQREKKTGGLTETLDVIVDDGIFEAPISTFSGGEAFRVAVALRMAIGETLAGAGGCLLIDEITDLDHDGASALVEILRALPGQVLLVSHAADEIAALPQQLLVTRQDAGPSELTLR